MDELFETCKNYDTSNLICGPKKTDAEYGEGDVESSNLEVPILPNMFGFTCLDYCLPGDVPDHHVNEIFETSGDAADLQKDILIKSINVALGELLFESITDYGFMHSSPFIVSSLLDAVKLGEEFANSYLASCLKEVDHFFKNKTQFEMRSEKVRTNSAGEYGVVETAVWCTEHEVKDELYNTEGQLQPMKLNFLDVQYLFHDSNIGRDFIEALYECENFDFFMNPVVQLIIDN